MSQKNTAGGQPYQRDTQYKKSFARIIPGFGTNPNALKPRNNSFTLLLVVHFSLIGLSACLKTVDFVKSPINSLRFLFPMLQPTEAGGVDGDVGAG